MALKVHLDTSAYSAFMRGERAAVFIVERAPTLALSPIVVGELKAGFAVGSRTRTNLRILDEFLASPRVSVLPVDEITTDDYARLYKQLRLEGRPIPTNDIWIAASATGPEDALFSYDEHFARIDGLRIIRDADDLRPLLR